MLTTKEARMRIAESAHHTRALNAPACWYVELHGTYAECRSKNARVLASEQASANGYDATPSTYSVAPFRVGGADDLYGVVFRFHFRLRGGERR